MSLEVFDTRTGAKIDPWKRIARLERDLEMTRNALHDAYDKIMAYHDWGNLTGDVRRRWKEIERAKKNSDPVLLHQLLLEMQDKYFR